MLRHFKATLITICLGCMMLVGCARQKFQILYTVYPIGYMVNRIVENTIPYQSIQDEYTIVQRSQIKDIYQELLENSSAFFHIGQLEPYMTVYQKDILQPSITQLDLSSMNAVYNFARYTQTKSDLGTNYVETPYYDLKNSQMDILDKDLYLWVDPILMLSMAKDIYDYVISIEPQNQTMYEENLKGLEEDLINLDARYQQLATAITNNKEEIKFASMTPSFGNWQKTYGFQVYPVCLSKYGVLPNEEEYEVIKKRLQNDQVKYFAYEDNLPEDMVKMADRLSEELGLTKVSLHNLASFTQEQYESGIDYITAMYENLNVLESLRTKK